MLALAVVVVSCASSRREAVPDRSATSSSPSTASVGKIQQNARKISRLRLPYVFGGSKPEDGGMDCSGSIQYLLSKSGVQNVPRTSFAQYEWVKKNSRLRRGREIQASKLEQGDLIFWGGTYDSGHKVSHVMIYLGEAPDGKLHMFGARSKRLRGLNGGGVDIHELRTGDHQNLIGYGRVPGVRK